MVFLLLLLLFRILNDEPVPGPRTEWTMCNLWFWQPLASAKLITARLGEGNVRHSKGVWIETNRYLQCANFPLLFKFGDWKRFADLRGPQLNHFPHFFCGRFWKSENVPKYWIDTALERLCQNLWSHILDHLARSHTFCYASNNNTHLKKRKTNLEHSCYQRLGLCIIKSKNFKLLFKSFLYFKMFYFLSSINFVFLNSFILLYFLSIISQLIDCNLYWFQDHIL